MKALKSRFAAYRSNRDGFIVVAVLWMLGALSALVSIFTVYVIDSSTGFALHEDRLRAAALVDAALELTAYQQLTAPLKSRPTHGRFSFRLGPANVGVEFRSEAARIDLNMAPKQLLTDLFVALGVRQEDAESFADHVIGWRTPVPKGADDLEANAYRNAGLKYGPRGAKFAHANELSLVLGLPTAIVERTLPFVTVHNGRPQINILDAEPEVIAALPGMNRERLNAFLVQRQTSPDNAPALFPLLGAAQEYATAESSNALRVTVRVAFDNRRQINTEVVILVFDQGKEPFSIVSWRENRDGPGADDGPWAGPR